MRDKEGNIVPISQSGFADYTEEGKKVQEKLKKIFEAEAEVDELLEKQGLDNDSNVLIQKLIFSKEVFKEEAEVREWANTHCFYCEKVDDDEKKFYVKRADELDFVADSLKTFEVRRGVEVIVGELRNRGELSEVAFSLKKLHRYKKRSVKKSVCLHVLLVGLVFSQDINTKEELQKIAEW